MHRARGTRQDAADVDAPRTHRHGSRKDEGETTVGPGDIVIQRGTNHGWSNRTDQPCRVAFVLIDGVFTDGLD